MELYSDRFKCDDGSYEDRDGCYCYDREDLIISTFCICGCGDTDDVIQGFHDVLERALNEVDVFDAYLPSIYARLLNRYGFLDHGVSCRCSWINDDGKLLLNDLKQMIEE